MVDRFKHVGNHEGKTPQTMGFLADVATALDFAHVDTNGRLFEHVAQEKGYEYELVDTYETISELDTRVYRYYDAPAAEGEESHAEEQMKYGATVPRIGDKRRGDYTFSTFFYNSRPTPFDVDVTLVHEAVNEHFSVGASPTITCGYCQQEVHWTQVETPYAEDVIDRFLASVAHYQCGVCSCNPIQSTDHYHQQVGRPASNTDTGSVAPSVAQTAGAGETAFNHETHSN